MKSFAEQINEIKNSKVTTEEKMKMLLNIGLVKSDCYALFNVWGKEPQTLDEIAYKFRYTFGVEIECYNVKSSDLRNKAYEKSLYMNGTAARVDYNHNDTYTSYKCVYDGSISGRNPLECVSPILNQDGFESLKKCCEALKEVGAKVNKSCGLHVHIGAQDLNDAQYINVFTNYQKMERVIDTFMAKSRRDNLYCKSVANKDFSSCCTKGDVRAAMRNHRYYKVNAMSYQRHQTIEFRQHQGSINYDKIQRWVVFCAKLVEWSKSNKLANEITSVDEIPFLTSEEKTWFKKRVEFFKNR